MKRYINAVSTPVPQSEPLNERQVENNAWGYVFALDDWKRLDRFLILGSDTNTYYQKAVTLTRENAACVTRCYDANPERTVSVIVDVSDKGRAPKNDAAIFALALGAAHSNVRVRQLACGALNKVCRTGTHLFQFIVAVRALGRGWGRTLKRAVANWYNTKSVDSVAYQVIKYRQRDGMTHQRLMKTAHPSPNGDAERRALYEWLWGKQIASGLPPVLLAHLDVMANTKTTAGWADAVMRFNLPWEALPTEAYKEPEVWQAMLPTMGLTALIRNLGNMTRIGAIKPMSDWEQLAVARIGDEAAIKKARVHPFQILQAQAVYGQGHGLRSRENTWKPSAPIVDALDTAFEKAFENVEPTGKRIFIGLDVSGSMTSPFMDSALTVAQAAAAMAMVTMRRESKWYVMAFDQRIRDLKLTAKMSMRDVLEHTEDINGGGTDCAIPMLYAMEQGIDADVFICITDNETWAGRVHPAKALQDYRRKTGINAKLIVMGMTSTGFTIADPNDPGMLDVVGMDVSVPAIVADFARN